VEGNPPVIAVPSALYAVGGRCYEVGTAGFAEAILEAHASRCRPRCMCLGDGVEMYVARLAGPRRQFIVKRMPETGSRHAPECPSFELPATGSGVAQFLGSAIVEDPATGSVTLKLAFPLTKVAGRSGMPPVGGERDSAATNGTRLSLRSLLHYLWDQAELTRWHPGFAGKRNWLTVRRHLLHAAEHKVAHNDGLRGRLFVPESFYVDDRDAINARRMTCWQRVAVVPGKPQQLLLLVGEVKEIAPARFGY